MYFQEDCEGDPGLGSCDILSAVFNTDIDFIEDEKHRSEKGMLAWDTRGVAMKHEFFLTTNHFLVDFGRGFSMFFPCVHLSSLDSISQN